MKWQREIGKVMRQGERDKRSSQDEINEKRKSYEKHRGERWNQAAVRDVFVLCMEIRVESHTSTVPMLD